LTIILKDIYFKVIFDFFFFLKKNYFFFIKDHFEKDLILFNLKEDILNLRIALYRMISNVKVKNDSILIDIIRVFIFICYNIETFKYSLCFIGVNRKYYSIQRRLFIHLLDSKRLNLK